MKHSDYSALQLTNEQIESNQKFLDELKREFIDPLIREFEEQIDGFGKMDDWGVRLAHILKLNEPLQGIGDYLLLNDSFVYAGKQLGKKAEYMLNGTTFAQYRPRFYGDGDGFRSFVGEYLLIGETEYLLKFERETYDDLPSPYKAALLCRYINMRVIAPNSGAIIGFVLGASDTLETQRFSTSAFSSEGGFHGWEIRIADNKPDAAFWSKLRDVVCLGGHVPKAGSKKRRKADPKTEFACQYVHGLEQSGINIDARSGGLGYKKIMADLELHHPDKVRHYEPDTFGRVYRAWKKKNGLA